MFHFKCNYCGVILEYHEDISGTKIQCEKCNEKFTAELYEGGQGLKPLKGGYRNKLRKKQKRKHRQNNRKIPVITILSLFVVACGLVIAIINNVRSDNVSLTVKLKATDDNLELKKSDVKEPVGEKVLKDVCNFYEIIRSENGFYLDLYKMSGKEDYRISTASTGIGLVSLVIADALKYENNAEAKIIETLKSCTGENPAVNLDRNINGLFYHFIDSRNGSRWGKCELSTIDTALLVAGATFCRNYFKNNSEIQRLSMKLWKSINWESCRHDEDRYYLTQEMDGSPGSKTRLFNEYLLLADYISYSKGEKAVDMSKNWRKRTYKGEAVITDTPGHFLPLFTFQFPLYLSPYRVNDSTFIAHCLQAMKVDKIWWRDEIGREHIWGSSAGASLNGYGVDSTERNPNMIFCAPSVAGFMPFSGEAKKDFIEILKINEIYYDVNGLQIPWRSSFVYNDWKAKSIQGIDLSPLLFGLAAQEELLGQGFFKKYVELSY